MHAAWLTANLVRASKFPPLRDLLADRSQPRTPEELRAGLKSLGATLPKITMDEWRARHGKGRSTCSR